MMIDEVTNDNCKPKRITLPSVYTDVLLLMEQEPHRVFTPAEVAQIVGIKPNTANKILRKLAGYGPGSGPIQRVSHGNYRYDDDKGNRLQETLMHSGTFGIENLKFVRIPPTPSIRKDLENLFMEAPPGTPTPHPGYPRQLHTGQEIRWGVYENRTEEIHFVSRGRPFSPDLLLYLLDELHTQGLNGNEWVRKSIEVNVDGRTVTLTPESVTLQQTAGILYKAYNHGQQARYEIADRRSASLADSLTFLMGMADITDVSKMVRKMDRMEKDIAALQKRTRTAINIASKAHEKVEDIRDSSSCAKPPERPAFTTAARLKAEV